MTPLQHYETSLQEKKIKEDPIQHQVILKLDSLYQKLISDQLFLPKLIRRLHYLFHLKQTPTKGIYLWGGVGRGKTFLMDLFFHTLPFKQKKRFHFHRFMVYIHDELKIYQGKINPLNTIARNFSLNTRVLCFDELYVSDISDAMILAELFYYLFYNGVTVVVTSNLNPEGLYPHGLQREKFLPTIDLILKHTEVLHLSGHHDYRLQFLLHQSLYHYPLNEESEQRLRECFENLAPEAITYNKIIMITHRQLKTIAYADSIVWFSFEQICETPRSHLDYIEIARYFHTVFISGVKKMEHSQENVARRFILLVDEFYDRNVNLIFSCEVPIDNLYQGTQYTFEFQRTLSRLKEMQSEAYLSKPHLA